MRYLLAIVPFAAAASIAAQAPATPQVDTAPVAFEVASVKRNTNDNVNVQAPPGRFIATALPAKALINFAYRVQSDKIVGGPSWLDTERYDVSAKAPDTATPEQMMAMLQALLAERFKLVAHKEMRDTQVYELVKARDDDRLGPRLARSTMDCGPIRTQQAGDARARGPGQPIRVPMLKPNEKPICSTNMSGRPAASGGMLMWLAGGNMTLGNLASMLRQFAGREVFDETGLTGEFDLELEFVPPTTPLARGGAAPAAGAPAPVAPLDEGASLFTALREQLGLKLEAARKPIEFLVIDSVERPTEN